MARENADCAITLAQKKEENNMDCFYCEKAEKLESLMIEIAALEVSTVYLNRDQKHKGRVIIALNRHAREYHELSNTERNQYFKEVAMTAQALENLYQPDKINYGTYGDLVSHLHIHMVPKHEGGLGWGAPFRDTPEGKVFLAQGEYDNIVAELRNEILNLEKTFE